MIYLKKFEKLEDNKLNNKLLSAVKNGNVLLVKNLIPHCNLEYKKWGESFLIIATINNNIEIVKLLLEFGANVDSVDKQERTSLMWASYGIRLEIVKLLIKYGANVNLVDNENWTALYWLSKNFSGLNKRYYENNKHRMFEILNILTNENINWNIITNENKHILDDINYKNLEIIKNMFPDKYIEYLKIKKAQKYNIL